MRIIGSKLFTGALVAIYFLKISSIIRTLTFEYTFRHQQMVSLDRCLLILRLDTEVSPYFYIDELTRRKENSNEEK